MQLIDNFDTLNAGWQAGVILMDFAKAFYKIDHQRFLMNLRLIGITCNGDRVHLIF